jgi:hypothetical protein
VLGIALGLLAVPAAAGALTLQQVGSGFQDPVYVTSDPANPDRLFVVERGGTVVQLQGGEAKPFAKVGVSTLGEGGLLSIALAPDFSASGRFYLDYTDNEGRIHVGEMVAVGGSALGSVPHDVMPPIPHPGSRNHFGGQLQFGPEGALFVSTGDGAVEKGKNAQDPSSQLGKILRLPNPAGFSSPEIWSLGLRNPFRFSFDRETGDLWIGDVGETAWEEVDFASAPGSGKGANFGWNCREGLQPGPAPDPGCAGVPLASFVDPVFVYPHSDPKNGKAFGCAVIGGYVARGPGLGSAAGRYFYGDNCTGEIRSFALPDAFGSDRSEKLRVTNLRSFGEDSCGRLYVVSGEGSVYRLIGPETATCPGSSTSPVQYQPALTPAYIGIRAVSRKVKRHRRGLINAWVTPCSGRRGDPVTLWRGRQRLGTRYLDRACSVRFRPRINRRSSFRATVRGDGYYMEASSRKVTIRPVRRR